MDGLVERPLGLTLDEVRALPSRTQITRHDCVEGWSVIGKWTGAKLSALLQRAGPLPAARYVVFYCADRLNGAQYYESIDMYDAYHPQTLLAYEMNGRPVPVANAMRFIGLHTIDKYVRNDQLPPTDQDTTALISRRIEWSPWYVFL